eukprot:13460582-Heterocapsa_arctica.AAC.1
MKQPKDRSEFEATFLKAYASLLKVGDIQAKKFWRNCLPSQLPDTPRHHRGRPDQPAAERHPPRRDHQRARALHTPRP